MRRPLRPGLLASAILFLLWELYATTWWVREAGGLGAGFQHLYQVLRSDWMARIIVSDHIVIAGCVLIALWIDAARQRWGYGRRLLLAVAFIGLGSPTLLTYLAWRLGRASGGTMAG
jgi:GNAT superfamily N-acetyltransferase